MVLREAGLGAGIGFWNFFNAMPYGGISQYDISEAELRWQVYTSLAIGSKGVLYFCYVSTRMCTKHVWYQAWAVCLEL